MSKVDYIKAYLDYIKLALTALIGLLFVIFWGIIQNEFMIKNISELNKAIIVIVIIFLVGLIIFFNAKYFQIMNKLEKD